MRAAGSRQVQKSSFIIAANGAPDSPPASGLIDYLLAAGARQLTTVFHPLTREDGHRHLITTYESGRIVRRRTLQLPSRPPLTYPVDGLVPLRLPPADGWFAFNNLLCARGLLSRRLGRARSVTYWAVDFVPDRFGAGTPMTRIYDQLDRLCCERANLRIDLSRAALEGRDERHGLGEGQGAPRRIVPIGAWLDRVPVAGEDGWRRRRLVFIGHLVERMGGATAVEAAALLAERGLDVELDIAGRGPLESQLRADVEARGLSDRVHFHGFISDHRELERLLSEASIALAPYSTRVESFTRFADPSKLKSYAAAGLPILMTNVPPNTPELVHDGAAEALTDDPVAFADAAQRLLADPNEWNRRRASALSYAKQFDWSRLLPAALEAAGFKV